MVVSFDFYVSIRTAPYTEMSGRESSAPPVSYAEVSGDHLSATGEAISGLTKLADR
jgi:hypothetical protein